MVQDKPPIEQVLDNEGYQGRRRGERIHYHCPVHSGDNTPSLIAYPDGQGHCYGCGFHGDGIDIIMALYGLDFRAACEYLNIPLGDPNEPEMRRKIAQAKKERAALERFNEWRQRRITELLSTIQILDQRKFKAQPGTVCRDLAALYHEESYWQYELDTLENGSEDEQLAIYKGIIHG